MEITCIDSRSSVPGPDEWFTGTVRIDPLFSPQGPARTAGASVTFEPGEKHWHGAASEVAMSHIAIQEQQDGEAVDWLEKVSDEDYEGS